MPKSASKRRPPLARAATIRTLSPKPAPADGAFENHLRQSVARLRDSLSQVLSAVGANFRVPHSITRDFGIDKSMASKLARVIREPDPYAAALDVPGEEAMRIFSRSMREAGAPAPTLDALRESIDSFQEMVRMHCGDRATLEMLAAAANQHAGLNVKQQQQQETFRKAMFRGASAIFGVQARVHVSADVLTPTRGNDQLYDVTLLNGLVDLRRIRSDVIWAVASMRTLDPEGKPGPLVPVEPVDPASDPHGSHALLIQEFCSQPVPELRVTDTKDSIRRFELPEGPVGSTSAVKLFTGWTYRNASPRAEDRSDLIREHLVSLNTPVELIIHDLFVHKDLTFARKATSHLYNQLPGAVSYPNGPRDRGILPMYEPIQDLSGSPVHPATPDVPEYARLIDFTFQRLGFSRDDFFGMRVQMRYPPIPSLLLYRYELPERGA